MGTTLDETKEDLIEKAARLAEGRKGSGAPWGDKAAHLLGAFYRHVAPEDIIDRSEIDVYGAAMSQYKLALSRPQGKANIRVFTPSVTRAPRSSRYWPTSIAASGASMSTFIL